MARGRGGRGGSRGRGGGGSRAENSNRSQKSRKSQSSGSLQPDSNTATKPPAKLIDLNEVTMGEFMAAYGPKPKPQRKRQEREQQQQQQQQGQQQTTAPEKKKLAPSAIKREQRRKQAMMSQIGGPLDSNNLFEKDYTLEDMECFMRGAFFPSRGRRYLRRNRNQRKAASSTISAIPVTPDAQPPSSQTDGSDNKNTTKTGSNRFLKQKERRENFLKFRQQALSDIENLKIADLEKRNQEMAQQILERSKQQKFDDNKKPIIEPNLAFVDPVNQIEIKIDKNQENKKVFCRTFSFLPRQGRRLKKKKKKKTKVGSASSGNSSSGGGGGGAPPGGSSPSKNNFNESNAGGPSDGSGGSGGGGAGGGSKLAQGRSFFHGVNVRSVPTAPTSDGGGTPEQNTAIPPPMDGIVRRKSSVQNQISGGFNRTTAETEMMVGEMDRAQQQQQQQPPILQVLPPGSNMDQLQAPVSYSPYLMPNEYQTVVNPVPGVGSNTWSAAQLGPDDKERISSSTKKPKNSKPSAQKTLPLSQTTPQKPMAMLPGQLRLPKGAAKGKRPVPLPRTDLLSGQSRVLSNALSRTTTSMSSATTSTTTNRSSLNSATPSASSTSTPVGFGDVNSSIVGSFTSNSPTSTTTTGTTNSLKSNKPKKKQLNYETKSLDSKRNKHHNQAKNTPTRKNAKK